MKVLVRRNKGVGKYAVVALAQERKRGTGSQTASAVGSSHRNWTLARYHVRTSCWLDPMCLLHTATAAVETQSTKGDGSSICCVHVRYDESHFVFVGERGRHCQRRAFCWTARTGGMWLLSVVLRIHGIIDYRYEVLDIG